MGLPKGQVYRIRAYPRTGIDPFLGKTITVTDSEGLKPIETTLELIRGVIVVGRLVDEATGRPVFAGASQYFKLPTNPNEGGTNQMDGGGKGGSSQRDRPHIPAYGPAWWVSSAAFARAREVPYTPARLSQADERNSMPWRASSCRIQCVQNHRCSRYRGAIHRGPLS